MENNLKRLREIIKPEFLPKLDSESIPNFLNRIDENTNYQAKIWGRKIYEINPENYIPITIQERYGARLIKNLEIPQNGVVVDLGCFLGEKLWQLPKGRSYLAIGVDIALPALETAQKIGFPNHKFILADVQDLPFKDKSVDIVLAFDVIEHLTKPEKGFSEIARILKPGGKLILHIPVRDNKWSLFWFKQRIFPRAAESDYLDVGHMPERMLTTGQIKEYLKRYHLNQVNEVYFNSFFVHLFDREIFKLLAFLSKLILRQSEIKGKTAKLGASSSYSWRKFYGKFVVPILEFIALPDLLLSRLRIGNTYFCIAEKV